ncbi:hypothetical protein Chor_004615 [Crotalus horridus]
MFVVQFTDRCWVEGISKCGLKCKELKEVVERQVDKEPAGHQKKWLNQLPSDLGNSHPVPSNSRAGFAENGGHASQKRKRINLLPDFDPALGMMTGIPPINPLMPGLGIVPPPILSDMPVAKEIIHCKSCTLFPPNPNLPPPTTRERPPGCKTVFVGGLPENGTEETIVEIFEKCGEIVALRKSKKHFCHIRFTEEYMVDKAVYLSARDDLYEWECKQRMLAREERHRKRKTDERFHPPSPPPVANYSDYECSLVVEKLKVDAKFLEAVQTLLAWLERGEVNRRTANSFYTMVQSVNSHIRRLMNEKAVHDKDMEEAKDKFKLALSGILAQFEQIVAVYHSACKQKAWDHFTKAQRKNISVWCKQAEELRNLHNDELMDIRREEAMEMSDDETEPAESKDTEESVLVSQTEALKEENNSLRCQLDAYRNEVELLKQEQGRAGREDDPGKDQQLKILQQTLQGMQQQELADGPDRGKDSTEAKDRVGIISTFLHVHPFGASIEYICSYLQRLDSKICATEVENLMTRLQHTFKQEMNGVGASLEKRWKFCGFEGLKTIT